MKILVIGATGTIGRPIVEALQGEHEVIGVSRNSTPPVDIANPESIRAMLKAVGKVDAIVCATGQARFKPFDKLTDEDFQFCFDNKLMGQANVIRFGFEHVADGGSITVTTGVLGQNPIVGSAAISLVNSGLEGFVRAAALEAPRGIRVNVVSPPWVTETLKKLGMDESIGKPGAVVAKTYVAVVKGRETGKTVAV